MTSTKQQTAAQWWHQARLALLSRVSSVQKAHFARNLSLMLQSGLTLPKALHFAQRTAVGGLRRVIESLSLAIESGRSFSEALEQYPSIFSGLFLQSVRAGEESGTLSEALKHVAEQLDKERRIVANVRSAALYPIVILIATLGLGALFIIIILPRTLEMYRGFEIRLPLATRMVIALSQFLQQHGIWVFPVGIVTILGLGWIVRLRSMRPAVHWVYLHVPIVRRIVVGVNVARFTRSLGTLLRSGMHLDEAMGITRQTVSNWHYQRAIDVGNRRIMKGFQLSTTLRSMPALFPVTFVELVQIGEESGKLAETLAYLAEYYEEDLDSVTKSLSTVFEPIALLIMGVVVGFLALSVMGPMYLLTQSV